MQVTRHSLLAWAESAAVHAAVWLLLLLAAALVIPPPPPVPPHVTVMPLHLASPAETVPTVDPGML